MPGERGQGRIPGKTEWPSGGNKPDAPEYLQPDAEGNIQYHPSESKWTAQEYDTKSVEDRAIQAIMNQEVKPDAPEGGRPGSSPAHQPASEPEKTQPLRQTAPETPRSSMTSIALSSAAWVLGRTAYGAAGLYVGHEIGRHIIEYRDGRDAESPAQNQQQSQQTEGISHEP